MEIVVLQDMVQPARATYMQLWYRPVMVLEMNTALHIFELCHGQTLESLIGQMLSYVFHKIRTFVRRLHSNIVSFTGIAVHTYIHSS